MLHRLPCSSSLLGLGAGFFATILFMAMPEVSSATRLPALTAKPEALCQAAVGKGATKLLGAHAKAWAKCLGDERKGRGACTGVDPSKAVGVFSAGVIKKCQALEAGDVLVTKLGFSATAAATANALAQQIADDAAALFSTLLASNADAAGNRETSKCFGAIAKAVALAAGGEARFDGKCMNANDKQQVKDPAGLPKCDDAQRVSAIAKARSKAAGLVGKACSAEQISGASSGAAATADAAIDLALEASRRLVCDWYPSAGNPAICWDQVDSIWISKLIDTNDMGWTGLTHRASNQEELPFLVQLSNCTIDGDERSCDLFGSTEGIELTVKHSPVIAPACIIVHPVDDRTGTIRFNADFDVLEMTFREPNELHIYVPITGNSPCPACTGEKLGDEGVCVGGPRDGLACVSSQITEGFPNSSLDCLPNPTGRFAVIARQAGGQDFYTSGEFTYAATEVCTDDPDGPMICHCPGQEGANNCLSGVCPLEGGFCEAGGNTSVDCFPSPHTVAGGNADGNEIDLVLPSCVSTATPAVAIATGMPGPYISKIRVRVDPGR